ncbi:small subunit ribosomal protein S4, partial [Phenoliferia sp. Uapishka_3]
MGHKATNPTHIAKCFPRMSWSPANLYNLHQRSYGPPTSSTKFTKSSLTLFQQKWTAKQLARGYHGDWIEEGKFKKSFMPDTLPRLTGLKGKDEEKVPLASMMFVEVEKRLDTVVFRCCFADSVYRARMMVVHGKVKLNGKKHSDPNTKLQPGDLITVDPTSVTTLQPPKPNEVAYKAFAKSSSTPSPPSPCRL